MSLKDLFTKKEKKGSNGEMHKLLEDLMVQAADMMLGDELIEKARVCFVEKFKESHIPYSYETLCALKIGMQLMSTIPTQADEIRVPLIMTAAKLERVERDLEKVPTK